MLYYLYGKMQDGKVVDTFSRPIWYFDNGEKVDDQYLAENENIYPINTTLDVDINSRLFIAVENDKSKFILNKDKNVIENYYSYIGRSIEDILQNSLMSITTIRDSKIYSNAVYEFLDGTSGSIQIRDANDLSNIRSLGFNASILNPDHEFYFADAENQIHKLSSAEILNMVKVIENKIQTIYNISHHHKIKIRNITDINELISYNFDYGWPN